MTPHLTTTFPLTITPLQKVLSSFSRTILRPTGPPPPSSSSRATDMTGMVCCVSFTFSHALFIHPLNWRRRIEEEEESLIVVDGPLAYYIARQTECD